VNIPRHNPSERPVIDLPTPERQKADLGDSLHTKMVYPPVTHPSTNPAAQVHESNLQPVDHKSDTVPLNYRANTETLCGAYRVLVLLLV